MTIVCTNQSLKQRLFVDRCYFGVVANFESTQRAIFNRRNKERINVIGSNANYIVLNQLYVRINNYFSFNYNKFISKHIIFIIQNLLIFFIILVNYITYNYSL